MADFIRDLQVSAKTDSLKGLRLTLCGGGGIAAIELPKIAREFRRHGATVRFFVTENCLRFVGREALEWASEAPVIVNPSGFAEHICHDDAVIVCPATADLIGKIAYGICPDGVTTLVQSALGHKIPVLICPTMHESLTQSPIVQANRTQLANIPNVFFVAPRIEEGKEKVQPPELLVLEASHIINSQRLFGKAKTPRIAITFGGTRVALDPVRCLTNRSTGSLGRTVAMEAYRRGLKVLALEAGVQQPLEALGSLEVQRVPEYEQLKNAVAKLDAHTVQAIFHIAAVSDYMPTELSPHKIASDANALQINLVPTAKLINLAHHIPFQLGCKLTTGTKAEALVLAREFMDKNKLNVLLWNDTDALESPSHKGVVLVKTSSELLEYQANSKLEIAQYFISAFIQYWRNCGQ